MRTAASEKEIPRTMLEMAAVSVWSGRVTMPSICDVLTDVAGLQVALALLDWNTATGIRVKKEPFSFGTALGWRRVISNELNDIKSQSPLAYHQKMHAIYKKVV